MTWFQNLMIRSKVMLAFATVLAVTALLGAFAITRLSIVNEGAEKVSTNYLVATNTLGNFSFNATRYRQLQASMLLQSTLDDKAAEEKKAKDVLATANKAWDEYAATIDPGFEQGLANKVHGGWDDYVAFNDKLVQLSHGAKNEEATALYVGDMRTVFNKFQDALQEDKNYQVKSSNAETQHIEDTYSSSRTLILIGIALAAGCCFLTGWMIVGGVSVPIRAMTGAMSRLAQHDLTTEIVGIERKDEVGQMANAVQVFKNSMIETDRLKAEQEEAQRVAAARSAKVDQLTRNFDEQRSGCGADRGQPGDARCSPPPSR